MNSSPPAPPPSRPRVRRVVIEVSVDVYAQLEAERALIASSAFPTPTIAAVVRAKLARPLAIGDR